MQSIVTHRWQSTLSSTKQQGQLRVRPAVLLDASEPDELILGAARAGAVKMAVVARSWLGETYLLASSLPPTARHRCPCARHKRDLGLYRSPQTRYQSLVRLK